MRKPTENMIYYAKWLMENSSTDIPKNVLNDFNVCFKYIGEAKNNIHYGEWDGRDDEMMLFGGSNIYCGKDFMY